MYTGNFFLGHLSRGDAVVVSAKVKDGETIAPGDIVSVSEIVADGAEPKQVEAVKHIADDACSIYGVCTIGAQGNMIPVVVSGHVIASINTTDFSDATIGECLLNADGTHCCLRLVQKVSVFKEAKEEEDEAYEVQL